MTDRTCTRHTSTSSLLFVVAIFTPRFASRPFAALLFCSGALGIELDVTFLPLIQVASDCRVAFPNQLSFSGPVEVILPLRHGRHHARPLPPNTSTSHSHYSVVCPAQSSPNVASAVFSQAISDAAIP